MNQSALHIADFEPKNIGDYQSVDYEEIDIKNLFKQTKNGTEELTFLLICADAKAAFKRIKSKFKKIKAAGGIVKNGKGEFLFIFRLGKWDLPKGKLDDGEKIEEAAVREVEEECGIKVNYRGPLLATTYHLYPYRGEMVIKKTSWYEMGVNKVPKLTPQKEEDITKAAWFAADDLAKVRAKTYPLIKDLLVYLSAGRI